MPGILAKALDDQVAAFHSDLAAKLARYDTECSVVVALARGGPRGASMPLPPPHGYAYTLPYLGYGLLHRSSILHIQLDPDDSRRRTNERSGPGRAEMQSALHHRVPDAVMRHDYGTDDLPHLMTGGYVEVETLEGTVRIPAASLDNALDFTSFLRSDPTTWPKKRTDGIHRQLKIALGRLAKNRT